MGVGGSPPRLYQGPAHLWKAPDARAGLAFALFGFASLVVFTELLFAAVELALYRSVLPSTARAFGLVGVVLLLAANLKSVALALHRQAGDTLEGLVAIALRRLWALHFWLNPLGLFSLGLFLAFAPRAQPPFFFVAYGVLLWQAVGGLLAREAIPLKARTAPVGQAARAAHHQPAVFVLLVILAAAGIVDSIFP